MNKQRRDLEPRRTPSVLDLDPIKMAAEISQLRPNHAHVVAAKAAAEVSELRHDRAVALRDASKDIAGAKVWQGYAHRHTPYEVVEARRAQPGPLARVPEPRSESKECLQRDPTAEAVARAHAACRDAVNSRQEEPELPRWESVREDVDVAVRERV